MEYIEVKMGWIQEKMKNIWVKLNCNWVKMDYIQDNGESMWVKLE